MLLVAFGILMAAFIIIVGVDVLNSAFRAFGVAVLLLCTCILIAMSVPTKDFKEASKIYETQIVSFANVTDLYSQENSETLYLKYEAKNEDNGTYYYVSEVNLGIEEETEKIYEEKSIKDNSKYKQVYIKYIENESDSKLVVFEEKGKEALFALPHTRTTYVFYVPCESVKEITK